MKFKKFLKNFSTSLFVPLAMGGYKAYLWKLDELNKHMHDYGVYKEDKQWNRVCIFFSLILHHFVTLSNQFIMISFVQALKDLKDKARKYKRETYKHKTGNRTEGKETNGNGTDNPDSTEDGKGKKQYNEKEIKLFEEVIKIMGMEQVTGMGVTEAAGNIFEGDFVKLLFLILQRCNIAALQYIIY